MKYIVEWTSVELVYPAKLMEHPERVPFPPAYTSCGGFLPVEAASPQAALKRIKRVVPNGRVSILSVV